MINDQLAISIRGPYVIANFAMLIFQFSFIFLEGLGRGRTGIGGHIPGGK
jgi:hypothetical protein